MGKACGVIAFICLACLVVFCGGAVLMFRSAQQEIVRREAAMTPEQKAEREQQRKKDNERRDERATEALLIKATEAAASKLLKTPSVAKFGLKASTFDKRLVLVTGHVDSQNSFGAMIREKVAARWVDEKLASIALGDEETKGDLYDEAKQLLDDWKARNKKQLDLLAPSR